MLNTPFLKGGCCSFNFFVSVFVFLSNSLSCFYRKFSRFLALKGASLTMSRWGKRERCRNRDAGTKRLSFPEFIKIGFRLGCTSVGALLLSVPGLFNWTTEGSLTSRNCFVWILRALQSSHIPSLTTFTKQRFVNSSG